MCAKPSFAAELPPPVATPREQLDDELVRDFPLRSLGTLHITNLRGGVQVQGWALDKIRVRAKRKVIAATEVEAKVLYDSVDFRYRKVGNEIELSAEYGRGLDIGAKLKERANPKTSMDILVQAPAGLALRVWSVDGAASVRNWRAKVEVRTQSGNAELDDVRSAHASVFCPACTMRLRDVSADVRVMGGTGKATLENVKGSQIFVETSSGEQSLQGVSGNLVLLSKTGSIQGKAVSGRLEFQTGAGSVEFVDTEGFASGRTDTGNISLEMRRWTFEDRALFESQRGSVTLSMPLGFAAEVDLRSVFGKAFSAFAMESMSAINFQGPQPANHLVGRVANGSDQLKMISQHGDVRLTHKM